MWRYVVAGPQGLWTLPVSTHHNTHHNTTHITRGVFYHAKIQGTVPEVPQG